MIFNMAGARQSGAEPYSVLGSAPVARYITPDNVTVEGVMTVTGLPRAPHAIFAVPRNGTIQPSSYWGLYLVGGDGTNDLVIYQRSGNYYYQVPNAYYAWDEATKTARLKVYNSSSTGTYMAVG